MVYKNASGASSSIVRHCSFGQTCRINCTEYPRKDFYSFKFIMEKLIIVAMLLMATTAAVMAAPAEDMEYLSMAEVAEASKLGELAEPEEHLRFRRVTCDLLSFKGVVNDSACAANCLSMGKAGGRCNNGVCECRKTTFKNLWDKRFG